MFQKQKKVNVFVLVVFKCNLIYTNNKQIQLKKNVVVISRTNY